MFLFIPMMPLKKDKNLLHSSNNFKYHEFEMTPMLLLNFEINASYKLLHLQIFHYFTHIV